MPFATECVRMKSEGGHDDVTRAWQSRTRVHVRLNVYVAICHVSNEHKWSDNGVK